MVFQMLGIIKSLNQIGINKKYLLSSKREQVFSTLIQIN